MGARQLQCTMLSFIVSLILALADQSRSLAPSPLL